MHIVLVVVGFLWPWLLVAACVPHPAHSPVSSISPTTETGVDLANMLNARAFLDESLLVITWQQYGIPVNQPPPTPHHSCVHTTQPLAVVKRGEYLDVVIATPSSSANFVFVHATKMCGWVPVLCFLWRANQPTRSGMQFRKESVWLRWKFSVVNNDMLSFIGLQTACTITSDSVVFRDVVDGP